MSIHIESFGRLKNGVGTNLYTLTNKKGMQAQFTDYGAIWVSAKVPTEEGLLDTLLGFDSVSGYEIDDSHMGCPIGRIANRTTNASVIINGKKYVMTETHIEDGQVFNLHSGFDYYDKRIWDAETFEDKNSVAFHLLSPHMDQGLPGNIHITITYTLTEDNVVQIDYDAVSDADTVCSMTNHAYFNLNGQGSIWKHRLWVDSSHYTETVSGIPTGRILPVEGTPYDYRTEKAVEIELNDNFCEEPHHSLSNARVRCMGEKTGIGLELYTDMQGIQIYTSNFLDVQHGKNGVHYTKGEGICFETQFYVNAININNPIYKKPLLKKNVPFHSVSRYKFINNVKQL